ncbi:MAG: low specificity L-threonine aldolase [Rikenellaceae bacterium]
MKSFGSDNHSGIHPNILRAIERENFGHDLAYGDDSATQRAKELFGKLFGREVGVYFVFNGTGANVLSLSCGMESYHSVICASTAHINVDECGAPERQLGCKVISVESTNGKLTKEAILPHLTNFGFEHHSQPRFLSIAQSTELGTLYTIEQIRELSELAHSYGMYLHLDGARIANAVAAMGVELSEMTCGVDVMSFGGTKNGMMMGEAVVVLNPELDRAMKYKRKQSMQLYSKMRFVAAQFIEYLSDGLWLSLASNSNKMAKLLENKIAPYVEITQPVEANALFCIMDKELYKKMLEDYFFYEWDAERGEVRLVCSFDTTEHDIENFANTLISLL